MAIFTTSLGSRQLIQIFDPANTANTYTPRLNPTVMTRKPGNVRKYTMTTNGTSVILGQREYPPSEITLEWKQMDVADFNNLRLMTFIAPVAFIDNNDNGYTGVLVIDQAEQIVGLSMNVWAVKASFLVLGPYNGQHTTLNSIAAPTLSLATGTTEGYIPASTSLYFWSTVFTPTGESSLSALSHITVGSGTNTNTVIISFTAPTSGWYRKLRIYWNSANNTATATMLTEILAGQSSTWTNFGPYVQYSLLNPPAFGSAFTGYWAGSTWNQTN